MFDPSPMYSLAAPSLYGLFCVLVAGLAFGSFASALARRVPAGESWIFSKKGKQAARSQCPQCHETLKAVDLVPFFSWLFLRGRCRYCHKPIGMRYLLIEIITAFACAGVYGVMGLGIQSALIMMCIPFLVALIVIDWDYMILPNQLVAIVGVAGLLSLFYEGFVSRDVLPLVFDRIGGLFVYAGLVFCLGAVMKILLKKESLGFGDVKFFAVAGLWLGISQLSTFFIFSGLFGIILGLGWQCIKKSRVFPFGPALIVAFYVNLLVDGYGVDLLSVLPVSVFF